MLDLVFAFLASGLFESAMTVLTTDNHFVWRYICFRLGDCDFKALDLLKTICKFIFENAF